MIDAWRPHRGRLYLFWLWNRREFLARYAGSVGGVLWALLLPLFTVGLFYVIFALVLKVRVPDLAGEAGYFYFLLAGLIPWLSISEGLSRAVSSLAGQEQFLQKLVFPVELLPGSVIVTSLVPQLVGTIVFIALLIYSGMVLWSNLLWLPLVFAAQMVMLLGLGLSLAMVGLYLRDLIQVFPVIVNLFFYLSPILYPMSAIPERFHSWYMFNPFAGLIEAYQWVFLGIAMPAGAVLSLSVWTVLLGAGGFALFRFLKPTIGDLL